MYEPTTTQRTYCRTSACCSTMDPGDHRHRSLPGIMDISGVHTPGM